MRYIIPFLIWIVAGVAVASEPPPALDYVEEAPEPKVWHISAGGGKSEYATAAIGRSFGLLRTELAFGWKSENVDKVWYRCKCGRQITRRNDVNMYDLTIGAYPTIPIAWGISIYAGGGIGLLVADFGSHNDETGVGKVSVGTEMSLYKGLALDLSYQGMWSFDGLKSNRMDMGRYDSHGPQVGFRYRF